MICSTLPSRCLPLDALKLLVSKRCKAADPEIKHERTLSGKICIFKENFLKSTYIFLRSNFAGNQSLPMELWLAGFLKAKKQQACWNLRKPVTTYYKPCILSKELNQDRGMSKSCKDEKREVPPMFSKSGCPNIIAEALSSAIIASREIFLYCRYVRAVRKDLST